MLPARSRGPCPVVSHRLLPQCPTGLPYLSGGGSCHLGGLGELWQAGSRKATFVPTPPPLGTAFTI